MAFNWGKCFVSITVILLIYESPQETDALFWPSEKIEKGLKHNPRQTKYRLSVDCVKTENVKTENKYDSSIYVEAICGSPNMTCQNRGRPRKILHLLTYF